MPKKHTYFLTFGFIWGAMLSPVLWSLKRVVTISEIVDIGQVISTPPKLPKSFHRGNDFYPDASGIDLTVIKLATWFQTGECKCQEVIDPGQPCDPARLDVIGILRLDSSGPHCSPV